MGRSPSGLVESSSTSESRLAQMALTWSLDILSMPMAAAALCTFLVLVPVAYTSATAATTARSTRRWRSSTSSGKKLPKRSLGTPGVSVPTHVVSVRSR